MDVIAYTVISLVVVMINDIDSFVLDCGTVNYVMPSYNYNTHISEYASAKCSDILILPYYPIPRNFIPIIRTVLYATLYYIKTMLRNICGICRRVIILFNSTIQKPVMLCSLMKILNSI